MTEERNSENNLGTIQESFQSMILDIIQEGIRKESRDDSG
jgi:hypothetical protein